MSRKPIKRTRSLLQTKRIIHNLNYILAELKLTDREVKAKSKYPSNYVLSDYRIKNVEIPDKVLYKIAATYDWDVEWFYINRFDLLYKAVNELKDRKTTPSKKA